MRILLDTNIIIHREASTIVNNDIGVLFRWIDNLHYSKYVHPISITELNTYKNLKSKKTLSVKLGNYNVLKTIAPLSAKVQQVSEVIDKNNNDLNDTKLLNELYADRVDILITEDKKIRQKASLLKISDRVFSIDAFLEKVIAENPELADYKTLAVQKEYFGNINIQDPFFSTLKEDYHGFIKWFNKKSNEIAYICRSGDNILAFLYLKVEHKDEIYSDISPIFIPKKRLKIGTLKVALNGYRLGERFLKIVFDNSISMKAEEIYVTIHKHRIEQETLINLLEEYGFKFHGYKTTANHKELVYVRRMEKSANRKLPRLTYPYMSTKGRIFLVPIYPRYHTELLPDSILNTESRFDFTENEPHRNAISKVYISRSFERNLQSGDIIVFYRTGGYYKSVVSTLGIVECAINNINNINEFIKLCRKRSVFSDDELAKHWNYRPYNKPFIVNFLYSYSFPKRINMKRLIEIGIIADINSAPRGFEEISKQNLKDIMKECKADESLIID